MKRNEERDDEKEEDLGPEEPDEPEVNLLIMLLM